MYFIVCQHKHVSKIEHNLNKNFSNICDWFVDNKLSIHFGEDKTKCILFGTKQKLNKTGSLNIKHGTIQIKQYHTVTYLGCVIDENLSGETMALKVISKISCRLRFLYRKNRFLSQPLRRLLCNALIEPHFDYACSAWYPGFVTRFTLSKYDLVSVFVSLKSYFRVPDFVFSISVKNEKWILETHIPIFSVTLKRKSEV